MNYDRVNIVKLLKYVFDGIEGSKENNKNFSQKLQIRALLLCCMATLPDFRESRPSEGGGGQIPWLSPVDWPHHH